MTGFSGDFGSGAGSRDAGAPCFGRGWIPGSRDIGIPGEQAGAGQNFREGEGDGPDPDPDIYSASSADPSCEGDGNFVPHSAWDASRKVRFLDHLSEKGDVRAACGRVGMSRTSAYLLRRRDRAFAQGWQAALVLARGYAEEVLATRALDGVEEAVWFRGEVVGRRRKYDTRLLLAHLARLDRTVEVGGDGDGDGDGEMSAEAVAERFDEALAIVAGARAEDDFPDLAPGPRRMGPGPVLRGPEDLPPPRADYLDAAVEPAWLDARAAWFDAADSGDGDFAPEDGGASEPGCPPERAVFHDAGAARWDGWQSRAFARVDALLAGVLEVKSMGGAGADSGSERAGKGALDRVNRVNLSARRPIGTARQTAFEGGNRSASLMLSIVKAGAALPPPLPSCAGRHFPQNRENRPVG